MLRISPLVLSHFRGVSYFLKRSIQEIAPVLTRLTSVEEGDEATPTDHEGTSNNSGKSPNQLETQETRGEEIASRDYEVTNRISDDVQEEKWSFCATAPPPAAPPARRGSNQPSHHRKQESQAVSNTGAAAVGGEKHRRGGSTPWGQKGITLGHLRQLTKSKTLALQVGVFTLCFSSLS